jgi:hypothetical protein
MEREVLCAEALKAARLPEDEAEPARRQNVLDAPFLVRIEVDIVPIFQLEAGGCRVDRLADRRCATVRRLAVAAAVRPAIGRVVVQPIIAVHLFKGLQRRPPIAFTAPLECGVFGGGTHGARSPRRNRSINPLLVLAAGCARSQRTASAYPKPTQTMTLGESSSPFQREIQTGINGRARGWFTSPSMT